jgi:DNA-binding transcriptional ArsR family regulator
MALKALDDRALQRLAEYFRTLGEPYRLKILNALRGGEKNVAELTALMGCSQANISRHMSVLANNGFVERTSRGKNSYYRIADPQTYQLCDLVCDQIAKRLIDTADLQAMFMAAGDARKALRKRLSRRRAIA